MNVISIRLDGDRVGWRLAHGEDGRGWLTRVPQEIAPISRLKCSIVRHLTDHQSVTFNEGSLHGTAKIVRNTDFCSLSFTRGTFSSFFSGSLFPYGAECIQFMVPQHAISPSILALLMAWQKGAFVL